MPAGPRPPLFLPLCLVKSFTSVLDVLGCYNFNKCFIPPAPNACLLWFAFL